MTEIDFGYWQCSELDRRRGLLKWSATTKKLTYDVPGSGDLRLILGTFETADDARAALAGWADAVDVEPLDWIRRRVAEVLRPVVR